MAVKVINLVFKLVMSIHWKFQKFWQLFQSQMDLTDFEV